MANHERHSILQDPVTQRERVVGKIVALPPDQQQSVLALALQGKLTTILPLTRFGDEDPSDLFMKFAKKHPGLLKNLRVACIGLANEWSTHETVAIQESPEQYGELLYVTAVVKAIDAIPAVARFARDSELATVRIGAGDDLQSLGFRTLSMLFNELPQEEREQYRSLYETTLPIQSDK